jgi:hypothetical protein
MPLPKKVGGICLFWRLPCGLLEKRKAFALTNERSGSWLTYSI